MKKLLIAVLILGIIGAIAYKVLTAEVSVDNA